MWAFGAVVLLSAVAVLGDYFIKRASAQEHAVWNLWFVVGCLVLTSTNFGWVFVMRHMKLAAIGVVYSISMILFLAAIGIVFFDERLTAAEMAGIALALASLMLLVRFTD